MQNRFARTQCELPPKPQLRHFCLAQSSEFTDASSITGLTAIEIIIQNLYRLTHFVVSTGTVSTISSL